MAWATKYRNTDEFTAWFQTEQEYIDAMFAMIIMQNYGIWLKSEEMYREKDNGSSR